MTCPRCHAEAVPYVTTNDKGELVEFWFCRGCNAPAELKNGQPVLHKLGE